MTLRKVMHEFYNVVCEILIDMEQMTLLLFSVLSGVMTNLRSDFLKSKSINSVVKKPHLS